MVSAPWPPYFSFFKRQTLDPEIRALLPRFARELRLCVALDEPVVELVGGELHNGFPVGDLLVADAKIHPETLHCQ